MSKQFDFNPPAAATPEQTLRQQLYEQRFKEAAAGVWAEAGGRPQNVEEFLKRQVQPLGLRAGHKRELRVAADLYLAKNSMLRKDSQQTAVKFVTEREANALQVERMNSHPEKYLEGRRAAGMPILREHLLPIPLPVESTPTPPKAPIKVVSAADARYNSHREKLGLPPVSPSQSADWSQRTGSR